MKEENEVSIPDRVNAIYGQVLLSGKVEEVQVKSLCQAILALDEGLNTRHSEVWVKELRNKVCKIL